MKCVHCDNAAEYKVSVKPYGAYTSVSQEICADHLQPAIVSAFAWGMKKCEVIEVPVIGEEEQT